MSEICVIGGGIGGLSAAISLANKGYKVTIFEKQDSLGGKAGEYAWQNFRWDTGPSLITMPFVFDKLFFETGKKFSDYVDLVKIDPIARNFFEDGSAIDTSAQIQTFSDNIAKINSNDGKKLEGYLKYSEKIYDITADFFLYSPLGELETLLTPKLISSLVNSYKIDPFRTVHKANASYFSDTKIQRIFDRFATYNGSNPYLAPATLNIIAFVEMGLGAFYPKGGVVKIIEAMEKLAVELGVKISKNANVESIEYKDKKVKGININGDFLSFSAIVANADTGVVFNKLLKGFPKKAEKIDKIEPSMSGTVFLWAMKGNYTNLIHHNVFYSEDYKNEFEQVFRGELQDDPTIYVAITCKSDPEHSAKFCENWFVMINSPHTGLIQNKNTYVAKARSRILVKFKRFGLDIESKILHEKVISPFDLESNINAYKGSIYGFSSNDRSAAFLRQKNRSKELSGLYFASGSAHPGGGMPLCVLSGMHAAKLLDKDFRK